MPGQERGQAHRPPRRPEGAGRGGDRHEREPDGEQHLVKVRRPVKAAIEDALEQRADRQPLTANAIASAGERDSQSRHRDDRRIAAQHRKAPCARLMKFIIPMHRQADADRNSRLPYASHRTKRR
jgi:hypothetical protein